MNHEDVLKNFISGELMRGSHKIALKDDDDLLNSGLITSVGILQLVTFIEERFGIQVPHEDVTIENFSSVNYMASYIRSRQKEE